MRADCKLKLEEQLGHALVEVTVLHAPKLAAKLAELRRPERQRRRHSSVCDARRRGDSVGGIETDAGEQALRELVIARRVEAFQIAVAGRVVIRDRLEAPDEAAISTLLQRLPAIGHVDPAEAVVPVVESAQRVA